MEGWLNSSRWSSARWRLDEQEPVDEQSQVEAGGGRRWMNSSSWRLEGVDGGDEQYLVESCFAVCHTPPDQQDPRFDRRRSVSSVLRYATPLPINRTPVSTIGGPFPPFCGTPHPSRSTGPPFRPLEVRFVHFAVRQTPPDEQDPISTMAGRT